MTDKPVLDVSNGHHWIKFSDRVSYLACRDCGIIRRDDDKNKPCKGKVNVKPRG